MADERLTDLRMLGKAIKQRWPMLEEYREAILKTMIRITIDPESTNRERVAAAKVLVAAESQNQKDEHLTAVQSDRNRFLEVAQQLGIDADFRLISEERATPDNGSPNGAG
jgi:hypothetical protein